MRLIGTEAVSLELAGSLSAAATDAVRLPAPLQITRDSSGRGHLSLLVLEMHGLGLGRLPPRFDYREVLYRLGVVIDDEPAWLAIRCDIDRTLVRRMAAATIRYPVRRAVIAIDQPDGHTVTFRSDDLSATLEIIDGAMPAPVAPARMFVVDDDALYEVPWDERPAPLRAEAKVVASAGDATITFDGTALIHRGRTHLCGPARRYGVRAR